MTAQKELQVPAYRKRAGRRRSCAAALGGSLRPVLMSLFSPPTLSQSTGMTATANDRIPASAPDWDGLKRDTRYFIGAQVASLGVLYIMPEEVSSWSEDQRDNFNLNQWRENVSNPHYDEDDFYLNYLLHPYWGASYYVRARERGYGKLDSFWYSTFLSTFYEVGPEALFEQPSIQDLIVTPVFGAWLGEYFMHIRDGIRQQVESRGYRTSGENWAWYLTDPLSVINGGIDRLLGNRAALSFQPLLGSGLVPAQHSLEGITGSLVPANLAGMVPLGIGIMRGNAFDLPGQRTGYTALTSAFSRAELFGIQHNVGFSLSLSW